MCFPLHICQFCGIMNRWEWLFRLEFLGMASLMLLAISTALGTLGNERMHASSPGSHPSIYNSTLAACVNFLIASDTVEVYILVNDLKIMGDVTVKDFSLVVERRKTSYTVTMIHVYNSVQKREEIERAQIILVRTRERMGCRS